ncbi:hypothetical protein NUW58_g3968 [Xylaria curta]|uniref:Uncharacterized protein n=1 Tax=Xylaria curta TaxID=42375 RepID=A0ACC1PB25_9PEZI|nr:hypothetical protein NUW58_g3968 [Xylaria curta]
MCALNDAKLTLSNPTFDLGLGCFGHLLEMADSGRKEPAIVQWLRTDDGQTKTAQELLHGNHIREDAGRTDNQTVKSSSEEERSHSANVSDEGQSCDTANRIFGGEDLLEELDNLEAARPKPETQQGMPGNREDIWEKLDFGTLTSEFDSWVDEVAALEASASMPKGTRYYTVKVTKAPSV